MELSALQCGVDLFNAGSFFEAHEALEEAWRQASVTTSRKRHLQGLVQLAVAFHHQSQDNFTGARSVLERAAGNLEGAEMALPELDLKALRCSLQTWREYLAETDNPAKRSSFPPLPQLVLRLQGR